MKGGAGRAVPGDNDAAAVEFVYEFFTDKGICVAAAADGGKYASAINTFKNINGRRCVDSSSLLEKLSLMIIHRINMSCILEYMI